MTTLSLIKEAIVALKDRTGSSVPAINKWIETEKKVGGSQQKFLWFLQSETFGGTRVFRKMVTNGSDVDGDNFPRNCRPTLIDGLFSRSPPNNTVVQR